MLVAMSPLSFIFLLACGASAADRRAETPRIELPAMLVAAPANASILPNTTLPSLSLPGAQTQGLAQIPALPAAAVTASAPLAPAAHEQAGAPRAEAQAQPQADSNASAPQLAPEAAVSAAPAGAAPDGGSAKQSFASRVGRILSRIVNPFGGEKKPEQVSPALAARRESYAKALAPDHWTAVAPKLKADLAALRALKTKEAKAEFLRGVGAEVVEELKARHHAAELGFHFNLHGGQAQGYVDGNGIRATMGDIALNYTMNGDRNYKVYFFRSNRVNLYDALNEKNPQIMMFDSRMGNVFMAFKVDSEALERGRQEGSVARESQISMDFETDRMRGVPYEAFAVPPVEPFKVPKTLGIGKLSRDEETLAAMRYVEALGLSPETPLAR